MIVANQRDIAVDILGGQCSVAAAFEEQKLYLIVIYDYSVVIFYTE